MNAMARSCIIIPNYRRADLLAKHLPGVLDCAGDSEVVVVDDASGDGSAASVRERFSDVQVIEREVNGGFSAAVNEGIRATKSDFVILLNNDVGVTPGWLDTIMPLFDDEEVFAVSPRIVLPSRGDLDEGAKTGFWHHGMFFTDQRQGVAEVTPILYATGAAAVYRREMLEQLGGFDEAYSPFYWEDTDLGYRAWKRGWKTLYQPGSLVYHAHSESTSKMPSALTLKVKARNGLFFVWRNIEDADLVASHRRWLPGVITKKALSRDFAFVAGWLEAYGRRDEAIKAREADSRFRKLTDREIMAAVGIEV